MTSLELGLFCSAQIACSNLKETDSCALIYKCFWNIYSTCSAGKDILCLSACTKVARTVITSASFQTAVNLTNWAEMQIRFPPCIQKVSRAKKTNVKNINLDRGDKHLIWTRVHLDENQEPRFFPQTRVQSFGVTQNEKLVNNLIFAQPSIFVKATLLYVFVS